MGYHWKNGPQKEKQNFPETSNFEVNHCFLKPTCHTLVHTIKSKSYISAALDSPPCPSTHPLPLCEAGEFTSAETCHHSNIQRGPLFGFLFGFSFGSNHYGQSKSEEDPALLSCWSRRVAAPAALQSSRGCFSDTNPMDAKWDWKVLSAVISEAPVLAFGFHHAQSTAASWCSCLAMYTLPNPASIAGSLQAPALKLATCAPPQPPCWKESIVFYFLCQIFMWKQPKIPYRGLWHNRDIKMPKNARRPKHPWGAHTSPHANV